MQSNIRLYGLATLAEFTQKVPSKYIKICTLSALFTQDLKISINKLEFAQELYKILGIYGVCDRKRPRRLKAELVYV